MKSIVVIGSNSFSGSHFIDLLLEKNTYAVSGISKSPQKNSLFLPYSRHKGRNFNFYQINIYTQYDKLFKLLDEIRPTYIVDFAGLIEVTSSWEYPISYLQTNTLAITNLVQFLSSRHWLKRYMHISSAEVYGSCHNTLENAALAPSSPYAVSKAAADMICLAFHKMKGLPVVLVRSTNVYGPGQQPFRIVPKSILSIKKHVTIPLQGGGVAIKSYIHIRDISLGELLILEHGRDGEIYNLSPDSGIPIKDLVKEICKQMHVPFSTSVQKAPERKGGQDKEYTLNSQKARIELGWKPQIPISTGVLDVVMWVDKNWQELKHMPLTYAHRG